MAQYLDPLIRSGAMWSCGRQVGIRSQPGWWSRIWSWLGGLRPAPQSSHVFRTQIIRPDKPRY